MPNDAPYSRVVGLIGKQGHLISSNDDIVEGSEFVEIVISAGESRSISSEMRFIVYELGPELFDPDSGVSLGRFEMVKGEGVITHVMPYMSRLKSTKQRRTIVPGVKVAGNSSQVRLVTVPFAGVRIGDAARPI